MAESKDVMWLVKAFQELIGRGHSSERLQQYLNRFCAIKHGFWQGLSFVQFLDGYYADFRELTIVTWLVQ